MMEAQASGKVILFGEHAVLSGAPCYALPLPSKRVSIRKGKWHKDADQLKILEHLCQELSLPMDEPFEVVSTLPLGAGLGSSAALCVALLRALRPTLSPRGLELARLAHQGETLLHGRSSGVDPYVVAFEKPLLFWLKDGAPNFRELALPSKLAKNTALILADSGERRRTRSMISTAQMGPHWPEVLKRLTESSICATQSLEAGDGLSLGKKLSELHEVFSSAGLSTPALERIQTKMIESGALGAKLTGAGGGGFVVGLFAQSDVPKALAELSQNVPSSSLETLFWT